MGKANISIKKISELSGVSIATVSRIINQNGRFSKQTEERVKKIIEQYGYEPNQLARGLRTNKVCTVGIIVPDITNEFFARVTLELQSNLFALGYASMICNTNESYEVEQRYIAMLKSQQVSGLVYISGEFTDEEALRVPTIYIDRKPPFQAGQKPYFLIESDNCEGGRLACEELVQRGCQKTAVVTFRSKISSHADRLTGYLQCLAAHGLPADESLICYAQHADMHEGYRCARILMEAHPDIDGFFCTNDLLAHGVLRYLLQYSIPIPERVRVVGFDDISISGFGLVPLTTIRQSVKEFGLLGANVVVSMIDGAIPNETRRVIPVELIRRSTT